MYLLPIACGIFHPYDIIRSEIANISRSKPLAAIIQIINTNSSPSWFSVTMDTGIVSVLLHNLPYPGLWLQYISIASHFRPQYPTFRCISGHFTSTLHTISANLESNDLTSCAIVILGHVSYGLSDDYQYGCFCVCAGLGVMGGLFAELSFLGLGFLLRLEI